MIRLHLKHHAAFWPWLVGRAGLVAAACWLLVPVAVAQPGMSPSAPATAAASAQQQADYATAEVLRKAADVIIWQHPETPKEITPAERNQLKAAARAIRSLAATYCQPHLQEEAMRLRYFRHLVLVGRYYCYSNYLGSARDAYRAASRTIPVTSPLRAKVQPYADELEASRVRVEEVIAGTSRPSPSGMGESVVMSVNPSASNWGAPNPTRTPPGRKPTPSPRRTSQPPARPATQAPDSLVRVSVAPVIYPDAEL